jgi:hypothetical protein
MRDPLPSLLGMCLLALGCSDARVYVGDGILYQVALTADTAPAIMGEDDALFIVETHAELPIKQPTAAELTELRNGRSRYPMLPFDRLPWVERGELELQLDFSLNNLDDQPHDVDVIVNGANEFFEYEPRVLVVDDRVVPLHSQWERRYTVPAKGRLTRSVREDEFDEVAVDLATVVNGAPNSDEIVYFENKSRSDERSIKYIPKVIPGLTAIRLGLRSTEAMTILLEATLRVRDVGDKLAEENEPQMRLMPVLFQSVVPES